MFLLGIQRQFLGVSRSTLRRTTQMSRSSVRTVKTSTVDWKPIRSKQATADAPKRSLGRTIVLGLMILMPVISFYLGTWQLRRLKWKTQLIAEGEDRLTYPPITLPNHFTPDMAEDWEYRKVIVSGTWDHTRELFVGPRVKDGNKGYVLFTPLIREGAPDLLIERGWISEEMVLPTRRTLQHLSLPQGKVDVVCMVRSHKELSAFQWEQQETESRVWQVMDLGTMTGVTKTMPCYFQAVLDLHDHPEQMPVETEEKTNWWGKKVVVEKAAAAPVTEEFNRYQFVKAGVPLGKVPGIDLKNNHLQYLVTWYGLSLLSSILLVVVLRKKPSAENQMKAKLKHARRMM